MGCSCPFVVNAILSSPGAEQALSPSTNGHIPDILTVLRDSYHLIRRALLSWFLRHFNYLGPTRTQYLRIFKIENGNYSDERTSGHACIIDILPFPITHVIRRSSFSHIPHTATISILQHRKRCLGIILQLRQRTAPDPRL